jgi:hypothetical protein
MLYFSIISNGKSAVLSTIRQTDMYNPPLYICSLNISYNIYLYNGYKITHYTANKAKPKLMYKPINQHLAIISNY